MSAFHQQNINKMKWCNSSFVIEQVTFVTEPEIRQSKIPQAGQGKNKGRLWLLFSDLAFLKGAKCSVSLINQCHQPTLA